MKKIFMSVFLVSVLLSSIFGEGIPDKLLDSTLYVNTTETEWCVSNLLYNIQSNKEGLKEEGFKNVDFIYDSSDTSVIVLFIPDKVINNNMKALSFYFEYIDDTTVIIKGIDFVELNEYNDVVESMNFRSTYSITAIVNSYLNL